MNAPGLPDSIVPGAPTFNLLSLELFSLQFTWNPGYQGFCRGRGIKSVEQIRDPGQIPAMPTTAFKQTRLSCLPPEAVIREFHSSGTTEHRPSCHAHSHQSLALYERSLTLGFQNGLIRQPPRNDCTLISLTPSSGIAPHSSLAHMCEVVRDQWGDSHSGCLGHTDAQGAWLVDPDRFIRSGSRAIEANRPLGILGTAFNWVHLLDMLNERRVELQLPSGSWAMETGGYKGRSRVLSQPGLHAMISDRLGIPADHIVREYGMSELSSQAYDRVIGNAATTGTSACCFHFPHWARARIISPENGGEVEEGAIGIIQVLDLANAFSLMAVQTEDLGRRRGGGFEWIGRVADTESRGCSLLAKAGI